jgi:hypothetical protein
MISVLNKYLTRPDEELMQVSDDDWLAVITQTCDVIATKLESEPLVELLHCKKLKGKPRRGMCDLQSTRYLDFRPNRQTHPSLCLTAHALVDRYTIPRELLAEHEPDKNRAFSQTAAKRILSWYALRAARPSWPNNFVDRISAAKQPLQNALEAIADEIAEVRIAITEKDNELTEDMPYHVAVFFVVDEFTWDTDIDSRKAINVAYYAFVTELNKCDGISVNEELSAVVSGAEFTWQQTKLTDEWNFANLSHREPQ